MNETESALVLHPVFFSLNKPDDSFSSGVALRNDESYRDRDSVKDFNGLVDGRLALTGDPVLIIY